MSGPYHDAEYCDSVASSATVSAGGAPIETPDAAFPTRGLGMRIKNLDTGEEYDIEDFEAHLPAGTAPLVSSEADPAGSFDNEEPHAERPAGKQAKVWVKGTKKFKTWAKSTFNNVRDKIEERIETRHATRQLHQQQQQQQLQQQLQRLNQDETQIPHQHLGEHEVAAGASDRGSQGGWERASTSTAAGTEERRDVSWRGGAAGAVPTDPMARASWGKVSSRGGSLAMDTAGGDSGGGFTSLLAPRVAGGGGGGALGGSLPDAGHGSRPSTDFGLPFPADLTATTVPVEEDGRMAQSSLGGLEDAAATTAITTSPTAAADEDAIMTAGAAVSSPSSAHAAGPDATSEVAVTGEASPRDNDNDSEAAPPVSGGDFPLPVSTGAMSSSEANANHGSLPGLQRSAAIGADRHLVPPPLPLPLPVRASAPSNLTASAPTSDTTGLGKAAAATAAAAAGNTGGGSGGNRSAVATTAPSSTTSSLTFMPLTAGIARRASAGAGPPPVVPPLALPVTPPLLAAAVPHPAPAPTPAAPALTPVALAVPLVPLAAAAAEAGGGHQQSEELRVPLLEEDVAGPSSRAVPTTRSWLNLPARVVGGRRAANRQLQQVRMIQELFGHDGAVWAMRFSADARLLASAGRDGVLRVWSVYWTPPSRPKPISAAHDDTTTSTGTTSSSSTSVPAPSTTSASSPRPPLLSESPLLALYGHRGDVLDLSWSQCRLLLTASADQTARLWHIDVPPAATPGINTSSGGGGSGGGGARAGRGSADGSTGGGSRAGAGAGGSAGGCSGTGLLPAGECLRSFVHPDFVTSCCFHPTDPKRIVTGCADGKIRVWSVPDAAVLATATVQQDLVTRVAFSPDGSRVLAGTLRGKARHYELTGAAAGLGGAGGGAAAGVGGTAGSRGPGGGAGAAAAATSAAAAAGTSGLDYLTQLDVKNAHGSGRKVTGLMLVPYTYGNDQVYVITSADSRIRLYVGYVQERKFKGHRHTNTQIAASLSPSCQHLICGSDDGWVYIWETGLPPPPPPLLASSQAGGGRGPAPGNVGVTGRVAAAAASAAAAAGALAAAARSRVGTVGLVGGLGGKGKEKEGTYEAFQTPETTTTVALVAPNVCRLGRGLERQAFSTTTTTGPSSTSTGGVPPGSAAAAASAAQPGLLGALFVVAGFSGRIYVYENLPAASSAHGAAPREA